MIPKVIHYCWFGGNPKSEIIQKYIASWKKYCPDYEIKEWTEENYDVNKHPFMKAAYEAKKWAFVSDFSRIEIIHEYGGVYLDTDVELVASLDDYLQYDLFAGFESEKFVAFGLGFGAVKGHKILKEIMDYYDSLDFPDTDFGLTFISCPRIQTEVLQRHGLLCNNQNQVVDGCYIFSTEYFCPLSTQTGKCTITKKTVSIHHYDMSWCSDSAKRNRNTKWKMIARFGPKWGSRFSMFISFPGKLWNNVKQGTLWSYLCFLAKRK